MKNTNKRSILVACMKYTKSSTKEIREAAEASYLEATGEELQINFKRTLGKAIGHTIASPKVLSNKAKYEYNAVLDYLEDKEESE